MKMNYSNGARLSALLVATFWVNPVFAVLFSSTLPVSRSTQIGNEATFFATVINSSEETATGCSVALDSAIDAALSYQQTDPQTNAAVGVRNTPVDILPNDIQTFVLGLTGNSEIEPTTVQFLFDCDNTLPASVTPGLNTLQFSANTQPTADVIALTATATANGITNIPLGQLGFFSVATFNVGSPASLIARAREGSASVGGLNLLICETNPMNGVCMNSPAAETSTNFAANGSPTFAVFIGSDELIALDPANNRVFIDFLEGSLIRGSSSVAIQTNDLVVPTALASADDQRGLAPFEVNFDGSMSSEVGGSIASYLWDFGDNAMATGVTATHTYEQPGTYQAMLTVTDNDGESATTQVRVQVGTRAAMAPILSLLFD